MPTLTPANFNILSSYLPHQLKTFKNRPPSPIAAIEVGVPYLIGFITSL